MTHEEKNSPLIEVMRRKKRKESESAKNESKFLVYFNIKKVLPLIGSGK
ncbi:MAG: hypothetical protein WBN66_13700 [Smithella sp.]